jgi:hypothetical protein
MNTLRQELLNLEEKVNKMESDLEMEIKHIEYRKQKSEQLKTAVANVIKNNNNKDFININIGGKRFITLRDTLLSVKDSFFERLVKSFNSNEEIFIDRKSDYFHHILDFYRHGRINYRLFKKEELSLLKEEAEYYNIEAIYKYLEERLKDVVFVTLDFPGPHRHQGTIVGTNNIDDLSTKDFTTGVCTNTNGWIIIEFNDEWDFEEIEIAGFTGDSNKWSSSHGVGAQILTSVDRQKWVSVGSVPTNFTGSVCRVKVTRSVGKYIQFKNTTHMGLSYLNIMKII